MQLIAAAFIIPRLQASIHSHTVCLGNLSWPNWNFSYVNWKSWSSDNAGIRQVLPSNLDRTIRYPEHFTVFFSPSTYISLHRFSQATTISFQIAIHLSTYHTKTCWFDTEKRSLYTSSKERKCNLINFILPFAFTLKYISHSERENSKQNMYGIICKLFVYLNLMWVATSRKRLHTTPWRRMGEWMYIPTFSSPRD
jgi:hypothetical protein